MAAVPIVIVGTIKDNDSGEEKQVTITGMAGLQGYHPAHPIPPNIWPDPTPPGSKPPIPPWLIWGGANEPFPTPPIYWPGFPGSPPGGGGGGGDKPPAGPLFDWKVAWSPDTGWIVVGVPNVPHPVPSA